MQITRYGVILVVFFLLAGFFYTSFTGPGSFELKLLCVGPIAIFVVAAAHMSEYKVGFLESLKMCFSFKTSGSNALVVLLIVWALVVITDMNMCHIGRDEGKFEAQKEQLELKMMREKRAKKP